VFIPQHLSTGIGSGTVDERLSLTHELSTPKIGLASQKAAFRRAAVSLWFGYSSIIWRDAPSRWRGGLNHGLSGALAVWS